MSLKFLRKLLVFGSIAVAGPSWATVAPADGNMTWQDIANVQWSTDGGANWGNSTVYVGQTVQFKFTMHKDYAGLHYADLIKSWIDLNGDQTFSDSETLLFGYHIVKNNYTTNTGPGANLNPDQYFDFKTDGTASAGASVYFTSGNLLMTNSLVGDHSLLARVTCSETLYGSWTNQWDPTNAYSGTTTGPLDKNMDWYRSHFSPSADYSNGQGESELRTLTVKGNDVPEPATLALFAAAMVGVGLRRKQSAGV